eukprot:219763_1
MLIIIFLITLGLFTLASGSEISTNIISGKSYIAICDGVDRTWYQANEYCNNHYNATLATIITPTDAQSALDTISASNKPDSRFWIALNDIKNEGDWVYANGFDCQGNCDALDIWVDNEPNNAGGAENCGIIIDGSRNINNMINDIPCNYSVAGIGKDTINILCNTPYEIITKVKLNWNKANEYCNNNFGTELATIYNDENAYSILQLINASNYISIGITHFFIGLTDKNNESTFVYINGYNGEPYPYWRNGEPNNYENNEDCVEIIGFSDIFDMFNDISCNREEAFICNPPIYNNNPTKCYGKINESH